MISTHSKQEAIAQVLRVLEREVEWPMTDFLSLREVSQLLAPVRDKLNEEYDNE